MVKVFQRVARPSGSRIAGSWAVLYVLALLGLLVALTPVASALEGANTKLTKVEPVKVCMVNNTLFAKDQIRVEVEGKTYFGCCAMCKERLTKDPKSRTAIDPVSKQSVDKATAVIGANSAGRVFYFENEENLAAFSQ